MPGVTGALVAAVARTLPWRALGAGAAVGLLLAGATRLQSAPAPWLGLTLLRAAALAFALSLAFLLDDPARHLTAPVPTRRWVRTGLRVALVAPPAALWWTSALALVPGAARPPVGAVTLEAAATAVLALATAATAVRFTDRPDPGPSVAAAVLTTAAVSALLLPARWTLLPWAGDPHWDAAHTRWALLLACAATTWTLCGPEPLHRTRPRPTESTAPGAHG